MVEESKPFVSKSELYFAQAADASNPEDALRAVEIGLDVQKCQERPTTWGLELLLQGGKGNSAIFEEYLSRFIAKYTGYAAFEPGNKYYVAVIDEFTKLLQTPTKWSEYCMRQSTESYELAKRFKEEKRIGSSEFYQKASWGWAQSAGRILREVYNVPEPGVRLY